MARKVPDDIQKIAAFLQEKPSGGRGRRSPLYRWLLVRADDFKLLLDQHQPSWDSVATALIAADVKDGKNKPPTAERVRKAWLEVRHAKGWAAVKKRVSRSTKATALSADSPADAIEETKRSFGTATPRGHDPSQKPVPLPVVAPVRPRPGDADRVLEDFVGKPPASRFTPRGED